MVEKWTKGPWYANAVKNGRIVGDASVIDCEKYQIGNHNATVATVYRPNDANLIKAAPDLYAALKRITEEALSCGIEIERQGIIHQALAALNKARGEG